MAGILTKLRNLVTSSALAKSIPEIEAELAAARSALATLEQNRGAAFFDKSDAEQAALDAEIDQASRHVRNLELACFTARQRRDAALEAERVADIEARARTYPAQVSKAKALFKSIVDNSAERKVMQARHEAEVRELEDKLSERRAKLKQISVEIDDVNREAEAIGRLDLVRAEIPAFVETESWDAQIEADQQHRAAHTSKSHIAILATSKSEAA